MPEKDPNIIGVLISGALGLIMAIVGGAVAMLQKLARGSYRNKWGPIADMAASGFAGLLTFALCVNFGASEWMAAFLTGMAGHAGVEALAFGKERLAKAIERILP